MTIQATLSIDQWPVHAILVEGLVHHVVMATLTELEALFDRGKRRGRVRSLMALFAHALGERLVQVVVKHGGRTRAMRIVAG